MKEEKGMEFGDFGHVSGSQAKESKRQEIICSHFIAVNNT